MAPGLTTAPPHRLSSRPGRALVPERSGLLPAERPRKRLVRMASQTDDHHGKRPADRDVAELMAAGVV